MSELPVSYEKEPSFPSNESIAEFFKSEIERLREEGVIDSNEKTTYNIDDEPLRKINEQEQIEEHEILLTGREASETIGILFEKNYNDEYTMDRVTYTGPIWKGKNEEGKYCDSYAEMVAKFDVDEKKWVRV